MVSKPNIGQCASKKDEPWMGVDTRRCASKDASPKGGGLGVPHQLEKGTSASENAGSRRGVNCEIIHWLGKRTKHFL